MARGLPWSKFDFDDFCGDDKLQSCSLETQGFYVHLLKVLNRAETPGFLMQNSVEMSIETLNNLLPFSKQTIRKHLSILKEKHVLKKNGSGIWYNRRMYKDWLEYRKSQEYGKLGGNPKLKSEGLTLPLDPPIKAPLNPEEESEEESEEDSREEPPPPAFQQLINKAQEIKKWDFTTEQDIDFFPNLLDAHSEDLILKVIEDLRIYQEKPVKKYTNLHATLRNWCANEEEWRKGRQDDAAPEKDLPLDDHGEPMVELAGGEIVTKLHLGELIGAELVTWTDKGWKLKQTEGESCSQ